MKYKIEIKPDIQALMSKLRDDFKAGIRAGMINLVEDVEARAVKLTPVRTGNLVNTITSSVSASGGAGLIKATAPYAEPVHEGTGIYGPNKKEIVKVPTKKKALYWPGARHPVKKVVQKGQRPQPFFTKALAQVKPEELFAEGVVNYVKKQNP